MKMLPEKILGILFICIFCAMQLAAQVQVSKEPLHKKVLENKYLRLMDVWLQPGDTSLYHIHSTPSAFLYYTTGRYEAQVQGGTWLEVKTEAGFTWYNSFNPDEVVHRVTNSDKAPLHVTDVELLAAYKPATVRPALPYTIVYENEKMVAYRITAATHTPLLHKDRGPILVQLVEGAEVNIQYKNRKKSVTLKKHGYMYIKPNKSFTLLPFSKDGLDLVLFEIK